MARRWKASEWTGVDGPDGNKIPADLNNDGYITEAEAKKAYEDAWAGHGDQAAPDAQPDKGTAYSNMVRQHADTNQDGTISHDEWSRYSASPQRQSDYRSVAQGNLPEAAPDWFLTALSAIPIIGAPLGQVMRDMNSEVQQEQARRDASHGGSGSGSGGGGNISAEVDRLRGMEPGQGELTPTYEYMDPNDAMLGESKRTGVYANPNDIAAQRQALGNLQTMGNGKYTAEEKAGQELLRRGASQYEQSQRQALEQRANEQGMAGSGALWASKLAAQQGGADRLNLGDLELQRQAASRALDASRAAGDLSSGMRKSGFDESWDRASADDEFAVINNNWRQSVLGRNNQTANQQQDANVNAAQQRYSNAATTANTAIGGYTADARLGQAAQERADRLEEQRLRAQEQKEQDYQEWIGAVTKPVADQVTNWASGNNSPTAPGGARDPLWQSGAVARGARKLFQ